MAKKRTHEFSTGPVGGELTKFRVHESRQCSSKSFWLKTQCQGVHGHDGPHWCYSPNGYLEQWRSKKDIKSKYDWESSITPPGHKDYPNPKTQSAKYYKRFDQIEKIGTEPATPISPEEKKKLDLIARHRKRKSKKTRTKSKR